MDAGTSAAVCVAIVTVGAVVAKAFGRRVCSFHDKVIMAYTSDIAVIKHGMMLITTYVTDKAERQQERDLNKEMIDLMMRKKTKGNLK